MKIIADINIPFLKGIFESCAAIQYLPSHQINKINVKDADCLITRTRTKCNRLLLEGSKVKFLATATIGFDHIDTEYCAQAGITWSNAAGCNSESVNQYVAAALAQISNNKQMPLSGKKIGIIGVGNAGSKVAKTASLLGMIPLLNDPPRERTESPGLFTSLNHILEESDIISLHVPLSHSGRDATFHLANEAFFERIRKPVIFLNTSRGQVVGESALKKAFTNQKIFATALDVWENEPVPDPELLALTDIATPHIAGYSMDGKANCTANVVRTVSRFFKLGIDDWYPGSLPGPETGAAIHGAWSVEHGAGSMEGGAGSMERGARSMEGREWSVENLVKEVILRTYPIGKDSEKLKESPERFEELRNNYPVRREFGYYRVDGSGLTDETQRLLMEMGFGING